MQGCLIKSVKSANDPQLTMEIAPNSSTRDVTMPIRKFRWRLYEEKESNASQFLWKNAKKLKANVFVFENDESVWDGESRAQKEAPLE